ncbi:hypothetical protein [Methylobacter sp. S3L5C]|uniref:hypothetical protein n=1 Tax=Methylobacter sp. S3L5C TaxID=2839024 RepID=UPI001FAC2C6E|nr:hypothetical protein [Methylobacter sp. S3L5C]UOA09183.1 hypothetical protein KKZ03_02370 [Methylobacter sp. S3L5C]
MLNANEAAVYIQNWVSAHGYDEVFKGSTSTLLNESRRVSRPKANAGKYGKIPYYRFLNGRVGYHVEDLKLLCNNFIAPHCAKLMAIKAAKLTGLAYYVSGTI